LLFNFTNTCDRFMLLLFQLLFLLFFWEKFTKYHQQNYYSTYNDQQNHQIDCYAILLSKYSIDVRYLLLTHSSRVFYHLLLGFRLDLNLLALNYFWLTWFLMEELIVRRLLNLTFRIGKNLYCCLFQVKCDIFVYHPVSSQNKTI